VFLLSPLLLRGEVTERIVALVNNEVIILSWRRWGCCMHRSSRLPPRK
jgi:hypothetical protein